MQINPAGSAADVRPFAVDADRRPGDSPMLKRLDDLFAALKPATPPGAPEDRAHAMQLATAVLLVEVMRADSRSGKVEKAAVLQSLRDRFELDDDELAMLYELAEQRSIGAHDLHSFTSQINAAFDELQKIRILEQLWTVAYADGSLDAHETHLMRRLADLLHVRQGDATGARLRAERVAPR